MNIFKSDKKKCKGCGWDIYTFSDYHPECAPKRWAYPYMKKLSTFLLLFTVLFFAFGNTECPFRGKGNQPPKDTTVFPPLPIPESKLPSVMTDFRQSPQGVKLMGGFRTIPDDYIVTAEQACIARIETFKSFFPAWTNARNPSSCEALLLQADGVLDTIPNYRREYLLTKNGIRTAGTVMFSAYRTILLLPDYTRARNRHYEFWSFYFETEHSSAFHNRANPPRDHWLQFIGAGDTHPQEEPLEEFIPEDVRNFPSATDNNIFEGLSEVYIIVADEKEFDKIKESFANVKDIELYRIEPKKAKEFFDYIDDLQKDFLRK